MNLDTLLVYLARGALTASETTIAELHSDDVKSLRHISREVSDILVPYLFDLPEEIYVSAYEPDLDVTQAVLDNPLLRYRVRKSVWDYSVIDHELLRYV